MEKFSHTTMAVLVAATALGIVTVPTNSTAGSDAGLLVCVASVMSGQTAMRAPQAPGPAPLTDPALVTRPKPGATPVLALSALR
ncbi:MAG: hypothetical protein HQL37_11275 [Alphaproteobacteria bacterium]|nr:hypothetical protein [Alphaproteobacteria bacterium]